MATTQNVPNGYLGPQAICRPDPYALIPRHAIPSRFGIPSQYTIWLFNIAMENHHS